MADERDHHDSQAPAAVPPQTHDPHPVGGTVGAVAGAAVGAVVGSFAGPIGTAAGAVVGGVLGGVGGAAAGTGVDKLASMPQNDPRMPGPPVNQEEQADAEAGARPEDQRSGPT